MAIQATQARRLDPIQLPKRKDLLDQLIAAKSYNPMAQGIATAGDVISQALQRRSELRAQADQIASIENAYGIESGKLAKLPPATAQAIGKEIYEKKDKEAKGAEQLKTIRLLEKEAGVPEGSFGDDLMTARFLLGQKNTNDRSDKNFGLRIDKTVLDWKSRMRNDPKIKPFYSQDIGLSQVGEMANLATAGNTIAASAIGVKMAKAMGEVGVLTDEDIGRYVRSGRIDRKVADKLSGWIKGRPSDLTLNEISQVAGVLKQSFSKKVQPVYNEYIETLSRNLDMTPDEAAYKLAVPYQPVLSSGGSDLQPIPSGNSAGKKKIGRFSVEVEP